MSDESRLEEQMLNEALQEDAIKRGMQKKTDSTPVRDIMSQTETTPVDNPRGDIPLPIVVEPVQIAQSDQRETPQQENFRYLREERERLEKKLEQERREKEELIRYMQAQQTKQQETPEEEEYQAPQDEYLEGKHLNKYQQQTKLRIDRETKARQESERRMYEMLVQQQLMMEFPDYRQVFTADNLDTLEKKYPDMAKSIIANTDPLSKRKATYDAIKAFVIPAKAYEAKEQDMKMHNEKITKNFNRPLPTSSANTSPLSKANAFSDGTLTEERKTELFEDWHKKSTASYNFKR
jgi:hypothetical protein